MLRTETDVKYIGDLAVIVPLDVPVSSTYEHLLSMIYSRTGIDKKQFQLVLNCRYPLKRENRFQPCPIWDDNSLSQMLKLVNTFGMDEIELYIEQVPVQPRRGGNFGADEMKKNVNPKKVMIKVREQKMFNMMAMGYPDDPIEYSPVQYHSAPSLQFENVENIDLQHAAKLYSLSQHQEYVVVSSTTKLLVLRCKKAEQSQCPWKLRAMVVKDSNLIAAHIQGMIKAQFTLSVAAIQASIVEKFGYQISYKKASKAKLKALTNLFGDFYKSYAELPHFFIALEQANPGCVPSIEGFKHCRPVLSIDGTHLYGKYKGTLMIAMGCDGNNQLFPLAFALTEDRHPGIMAAMSDVHLGWSEPYAYHRVCMRHLASNFMTRFKDKILKNLMCRAALATKIEKFNKHMNTIGRINAAAQQWLEAIPFEKWALSHDGGRSYFVVRREQGANRLASSEEYTPYVDAKMKANVVKAGSHEIVLYDHIQGQFHVKSNRGTKSSSTRGRTYRVNLQEYACTCGKTLIYGFPCSHILAACHFRSVDFRPLVQHYYSTQSYYNTWAPLFHPIFNVYEWPPYDGPIIMPSESMKRASSGRPKSSRLHNEMDVREGKTSITYMEYRGHSSDPDPLDTSILVLQDRHRSHLVDSGQLASVLTCRQHISRGDSPTSEIKGSAISTRWLCHQFSHPPVDLDDATLEQYARAFILGLIGSALFTDKKVLAHLYRELCRASLDGATDIAGCVTLLQDEALLHEGLLADPLGCRWRVPLSWAQNPSRVLTFYRDQLDAQTHDQVLWEPYMGDLVAHLRISLADQEIWRRCHLLSALTLSSGIDRSECCEVWPQQGIPPSCSIEQHLHSVDRRGRHKYDWEAFHAQYITLWASRAERIVTAPPMVGAMQFHDPYMEWYRRITRTFDHTPSP
ncbi:Serine/threonine-protein phosphatase 7 long form-like [Vitis vinifera]|uniref:Serine/threonine-protein phosphatase 7 long form-like n=1 Tax=Vitis vinifera TaxID=29760 RepID=A0A438K675_VITVI|nr:Serine/threonine-protein phosphatase 7 long form-like [Vitis vinifera]